jgi:hypothetical protein
MPIPRPTKGESELDFISRCMADDVMNSEYPDNKQRAAVCYSTWRDKKMDAMADKIVAAELAVDEQDILVRFFKRGREMARKFFDSTRDAIHDAIAYVNEGEEDEEREAEVLVNGKVVRQFSASPDTQLSVSIPSGLRGKKLYDLDDREFQLGGFIDELARKAGYSSGRSWANEHNAWNWTVEEAVEVLASQLSAQSSTLRLEREVVREVLGVRDDTDKWDGVS